MTDDLRVVLTGGSQGYVGAKQMLWCMAHSANTMSRDRDLGIDFQTLAPMQFYSVIKISSRTTACLLIMGRLPDPRYLNAVFPRGAACAGTNHSECDFSWFAGRSVNLISHHWITRQCALQASVTRLSRS